MQFWKQILSEDNGQGSYSRLVGTIIVLALIAWASVLVYKTKTIHDIPPSWLALILGLYGINKLTGPLSAIILASKGQDNAQQAVNTVS